MLNPGSEEEKQSEEEKARGLTRGSPGTPSYTAPEVWGSGAYHGKTADVWSLGVTLHAMVFGTLPFFALDQQQLIKVTPPLLRPPPESVKIQNRQPSVALISPCDATRCPCLILMLILP